MAANSHISIPKVVCFTGIDGCGKTTQAKALVHHLRAQGYKSRYVWLGWSPALLKPIVKSMKHRIVKKRQTSEDDYAKYTLAKRGFFLRRGTRLLWTVYVALDYALQVLVRVFIPVRLGHIVVCDRYFHDVLIDLAINYSWTAGEFRRVLRTSSALVFPVPDKTFVIDVPEDVAFNRKNDVTSIEYLRDRRNLYLAILSEGLANVQKLSGESTISDIQQQVQCSLHL